MSAVYARTWREAWTNLNGTSMYEMLRLLDQIDRTDLRRFLEYAGNTASSVSLPRIVFAASVVEKRAIPANSGTTVDLDVRDARAFLAGRSPLRITKDATKTLPAAMPNMAGLSTQDFENAAMSLNVEAPTIRAVAWVESGGSTGFAADGRASFGMSCTCSIGVRRVSTTPRIRSFLLATKRGGQLILDRTLRQTSTQCFTVRC